MEIVVTNILEIAILVIYMVNKRPKKPTRTFGVMAFPKHGKPYPIFEKLSSDKEKQESGVITRFAELFNKTQGNEISAILKLPENDNDFQVYVDDYPVKVEITELVDREYLIKLTEDEYRYHSQQYVEFELKKSGDIPYAVDVDKRDNALANSIKMKLEKNYSHPIDTSFWLLVFCVSHYVTEYHQAGKLHVSQTLTKARDFLSTKENVVFDEIWFFNMIMAPVKVWPE